MKGALVKTLSVAFFVAMFSVVLASSAFAATIYTDKPDYAPNENVTIIGLGFLPNHPVWITIIKPGGYTFTTTSSTNSSGIFVYVYNNLPLVYGTYHVSATDLINFASTTFTDAAVFLIHIDQPLNNAVIGFGSPVRVVGYWQITNNPPGNAEQYNVSINWGDGQTNSSININRTATGSNPNDLFNGTFDTEPIVGCTAADGANDACDSGNFDHTYLTCGPFAIIARLYHQQTPGSEESSTNVNITVAGDGNCPTTTTTTTTTTTSETTTTTTTSETTTTTTTTPEITTTTTTTTSQTTTTTKVIVAAPTAVGIWPYVLVVSFIGLAAWSMGPMFTKFLSVNFLSTYETKGLKWTKAKARSMRGSSRTM